MYGNFNGISAGFEQEFRKVYHRRGTKTNGTNKPAAASHKMSQCSHKFSQRFSKHPKVVSIGSSPMPYCRTLKFLRNFLALKEI
ncbi:hypothetical protein M5K25_019938 [Dendrobium thyrsiflorum]|uniref:Uncharacterized protein n=1 Tax=Dendrobium thyrsiflorum TaxID=117978 RepID=A0ABD0UGB2_DENTH